MDLLKIVKEYHCNVEQSDEDFNYCEEHLVMVDKHRVVEGLTETFTTVYKDTLSGKFYKASATYTCEGCWRNTKLVESGCVEVQ